ncbi:hypothetical protein DPF89_03174 [Salmonella enterica subsp. enterica serovar Napoli]|nr:hypothetical protein DPF89_03174 [Salmonella enterica subsp. enterica serovar Napoli]
MLERERLSSLAIPSRTANSSSSRRSKTIFLGLDAFGARDLVSRICSIVIYSISLLLGFYSFDQYYCHVNKDLYILW